MPCGIHLVSDWSQCVGHRTPCPANRPFTGTVGSTITASQVEALRSTIALEVAVWKNHRFHTSAPIYSTSVARGSVADDGMWNQLERMVHLGAAGHVEVPGDPISITDNFTRLRNDYESLRVNCICNTDCGCNTVCACNQDCGCNYSDMRLKMEIQYC